ncbi:MAG: 5-formyltetrahydrofolate cyclo-ligase [Lachnospiraceae bacterium]|nr:5-formyltetrahydrofolate cyclo-ligase [Lachnospiraceae bacterium]
MDTMEAKKVLRKEVYSRIAALDDTYKKEADRAIVNNLLALPEYQAAKTVFCFVGTEHEINTRPFLLQALEDGKRVAVPLCIRRGFMDAKLITSLDDLKESEGKYKLWEPAKNAPMILAREIDFSVIPCLTCDHEGNRLGHGGGFYDRYFKQIPDCPSAIICREKIISDDIPTEFHDQSFDKVVTEKGVYVKGQLQ